MKKLFKLLLLSPMILTMSCNGGDEMSSSEMKTGPVDVVIISGQSNAVGCTHANCITRSIGAAKYQEYMSGYPTIQIAFDNYDKQYEKDPPLFYSQHHSKNDNFVKVMLGQGNSEATFGPEIGIAESLHESHANKLFLIKFACGASNLKDDWAQPKSPMYPRFIEYVKLQMKNLTDMGYEPTIKAFCWMQGEGDTYPDYYDVYYDNLKLFVTNVRKDLKSLAGNKDMPFIDAGVANTKKEDSTLQWQYWEEVNEAKKKFANESSNNFYIDTIEAGMHTNEEPFGDVDYAHYDSPSEVQLGKLFAEKFKPFLMK